MYSITPLQPGRGMWDADCMLTFLVVCCCSNHRDTCVGIHINMPLAMPSLSNPLHLLQLANALLAPSVPLLLSAQELQALQVGP
jgi:hypothetical protein